MKHDTGAKVGLNSARQLCLSMSNKGPLSIMRLLGFEAAQKSVIDIMFRQERSRWIVSKGTADRRHFVSITMSRTNVPVIFKTTHPSPPPLRKHRGI